MAMMALATAALSAAVVVRAAHWVGPDCAQLLLVGTRCEGIRCSQFASGPQQHAFRRKCQHAVDEKHRLDHDQRELAVLMPGSTPCRLSVVGILSHGTGQAARGGDGGDPQLQHYHLRQVDSNPANDEFHSMYCGHQHSTTTTTTTGTASNLSPECQLLSKIIRSNMLMLPPPRPLSGR